jgi:nucleoside-diphosphate-sugar epimerase
MKKILILGGAGFIGFNIATYLVTKKRTIKLLLQIIYQEEKWMILFELEIIMKMYFIEGDFTKEEDLRLKN